MLSCLRAPILKLISSERSFLTSYVTLSRVPVVLDLTISGSFTDMSPFAFILWFYLTVGPLLPPELKSTEVKMGSVLVTAIFPAPRMVPERRQVVS